jgi:transcriptional regulator with XRE-family HTH domain
MDAFLEKLKKSFVERFTSLMEDNGDSVTEAARIIGVAPEAVSTWLRGRIVPSIDYFAKIADVYNVSVDYLLGQSETQQVKDIPDEAAYPAVPARAFYNSALQLMAKQNSLIAQQNALLQQQNAILKAMQQKLATESVSVSLTDGSVDLPF